jgi:hypothetical protein
VHSLHRVENLDIDLGSVERTVARVDAPVALTLKLIEHALKRGLCIIPGLHIAHRFLRPGGKLQFVGHTEDAIHVFHELKSTEHFLLDLVVADKDMSVILLEAADAG